MFLFQEQETEELRRRAERQPYIYELLQSKTDYPAEKAPIVPKVSRGDWGMYYHCPEDSAALSFNWKKPQEHVCPVCGKSYSGGHYDGAWESRIHNENADAALRLAYRYVLDQDPKTAAATANILKLYARHYPHYREHGDIPYNGPGLAFAQTLDEAVFLRRLGYAYDMTASALAEGEKQEIRERLFRTGAEFLLAHRTEQIHNHEVLIDASIGILGLLLDDKELIEQGVYAPFGLNDQRRRGTLKDDFWFEGSVSYHDYALSAFFAYEIFARYTPYSNLSDNQYLRMLKRPKNFLMPGGIVPALNDSRCLGERMVSGTELEFGYRYYRDPQLLEMLQTGYREKQRKSVETFFYGIEKLPTATKPMEYVPYHNEDGSGITVFRGSEERYLLVKHSPFGGEHDHYDRLGISFSAFGDQLCSDLGTVPYGVPWHYDYYKNTATHNTVVVEEANQPPQNCRVLEFRTDTESSFLDCRVSWDKKFFPLPTFVIKQWEEGPYTGTVYRRRVLWKDYYFIDVVTVRHPQPRCTDWVLHVDGKRKKDFMGERITQFSGKKPFCYLSDVKKAEKNPLITQEWKTPHGFLRLLSYMPEGELYTAKGPNLPPNREIDYVIQRQKAYECLFVNVFETYASKPKIRNVQIFADSEKVKVTIDGSSEIFYVEET